MYHSYKKFDNNKIGAKLHFSKFYALFVKKTWYQQLAPS